MRYLNDRADGLQVGHGTRFMPAGR